MEKRFLLGNEAVALGALDAGVGASYAYPGTPSTEITEFILGSRASQSGKVHCRWTANEKTALEAALGASYAGRRAMATMKHVGLNVASDAFVNAAVAGPNAGLVVVVADDPSMHSSQNEQDSRLYTDLALVPCLEPSDQQEAYDMPRAAFDLSERHGVPVLVRLTTRLAHSRADITPRPATDPACREAASDRRRYVLLPVNARGNYERLVSAQAALEAASETSPFNRLIDGADRRLGIVACGLAVNYVLEAFDGSCPHPLLKISQYPIPSAQVERLLTSCDRVLVVEEGYPYVEGKLRGVPPRATPRILGRQSGEIPRTGELTPQAVRAAVGMPQREAVHVPSTIPVPRPPALCSGCPHADGFRALSEAMAAHGGAGRVFSDIGCYTLGALPPYDAIDTCIDMGASITMARGAADAGLTPAVAVIGDSTFVHSGMTGLLDCVADATPVTVVLLDNSTVAMTGGQPSLATDRLVSICRGLGVDTDHLRTLDLHPTHHAENVRAIAEELSHPGPSVIIGRRECIQTARRRAAHASDKEAS